MVLSYLQIATIAIISFALGGMIVYTIMKHRIKSLKEAVSSMDASLRGMWNTNESVQKKKLQSKQNQVSKPSKSKEEIIAKHASDEQAGTW